MRISLAITPYFTNGDSPPLGLAYLNSALTRAGHDVSAHDFIYFILKNHEPYFSHFRKIVNLGQIGRRVPFFLGLEFTLYNLYRKQYPRHPWLADLPAPVKAAWGAAGMMLEQLTRTSADMALQSDPELILLSSYTSNIFSTLPLAMELKRRSKAPLVIGGPGVGLPEVYEWILAAGFADGVVVGEGERTIVELAAANGKLPDDLPGLALPGRMPIKREFIRDLDELPPPMYDGLPAPGLGPADYQAMEQNAYKSNFFVGLPVMSSRGCANKCAYCSETTYWRSWRHRRPDALAKEIAETKERTGRDVFLFCDSALNLDPKWLGEFCDAVTPLKVRFLSYMVAGRDVSDLAPKMYKAGWRGAIVGVETLSDRLRKLVKKRRSSAEAMDTLRAFARADIWAKGNILCGFPTETDDDISDTIMRMETLNAEPDVKRRLWWDAGHPLRLEPYSDMYRNPAEYNIKIEPYSVKLPPALSDQQGFIDRLTKIWDPGIDPDVVAARSRRIIDAARNPT